MSNMGAAGLDKNICGVMHMGFMDKVKGLLNIGGPKISIQEVNQPIVGKSGTVTGRCGILSSRAAKVAKSTHKFYCEETKGQGDEKTVETTVIGESSQAMNFEVQPNINCIFEFRIDYDTTGMLDKMAGKGGMLGALGKVGQFASGLGEKGLREYYVEVTCDVVGTPLDPSDKMIVQASID